jgi:hypothetical protein
MYIKPAEGRAPRDPRTMLRIPREGMEVSEHDPSFAALRWHGDVIECEPPAPVSEVAAERIPQGDDSGQEVLPDPASAVVVDAADVVEEH